MYKFFSHWKSPWSPRESWIPRYNWCLQEATASSLSSRDSKQRKKRFVKKKKKKGWRNERARRKCVLLGMDNYTRLDTKTLGPRIFRVWMMPQLPNNEIPRLDRIIIIDLWLVWNLCNFFLQHQNFSHHDSFIFNITLTFEFHSHEEIIDQSSINLSDFFFLLETTCEF